MTRGRELRLQGISVELIVPNHVVEFAAVHLVERGSERIFGRVADTPVTLPKRAVGAAGNRELLSRNSNRAERCRQRCMFFESRRTPEGTLR